MIRKLNLNDITELQKLCTKTFYDAYGYANTKENMDNYVLHFFSIEVLKDEIISSTIEYYGWFEQHTLIGYCKLQKGIDENQNKKNASVELARFYVLNTKQSNGIGKKMLHHIFSVLCNMRFEVIWLTVWQENKRAIHFYENNGFICSGTTTFMLGSELNYDFIYKIKLSTISIN